jgi:hypothetical protein
VLRFFGSDIGYIEPVKLKPKQKTHIRIKKEREEMRATLEAVRPQDVADGQLPPALRKAFTRREQVEIIRAKAKAAYDKEAWPLYAFSDELDLLVRWKVIPPSEAKQGKGWARKPGRTRDEIMEARTWIGDHYFDDAYLGLLRDTRNWAEEEATK